MKVTVKPDLRSVADCTRELNKLSLHPSLPPAQRLINLTEKADLLLTRARFKDARTAQVSRVRAAQLLREAREDRRLAETLRRQYERLSRKARP